jgi:hypothetical protein
MRITPDDDLYRVHTVWLGPKGFTFPWTARYLAYAVWLVSFLGILAFEAATPLRVHLPPIWEVCIAVLATYGILTFVDHERPIGSIWRTFIAELATPRPTKVARWVAPNRSLNITGRQ